MAVLESLLSRGRPRHYPAGEVIYPAERVSSEMYYLFRGQVKQSILTTNGVEKTLGWVRPGCMFGEALFLTGCPSQASAVAVEDSLVYVFSRRTMEELFVQHPELLYEVARSLSYKVRLLTSHIWVMASEGAADRIGKLLYLLTRDSSDPAPTLQLTHQALADLASVHRVTASQALARMSKEGVLERRRGQITIRRRDLLERFRLG